MFRYHILASGSSGNLTLIQSPEANVVIDCGISGRRVVQKLNSLGLSLEDLDAVLVTHSHSDHTQGLPQVTKVVKPCLSNLLYDAISDRIADHQEPLLFRSNEAFWIKDIHVLPVRVSHDCVDPVCFVLRCGEDKMAVVTDLGEVNASLVDEIHGARVVIMEANHDLGLLSRSPRPVSLKNRIISKVGHLSNRSSGRFLADVHSETLEEVILVHLSRDCNTPELALETIKEEMQQKQIVFDQFRVAGPEGILGSILYN